MEITTITWTIAEVLQAVKDGQLIHWVTQNNVTPGQIRVAEESGILSLLTDGFRLRNLVAIETQPKKYEIIRDNVLLYLVALDTGGAFDKLPPSEKATALNSLITITVYHNITKDERFILEHYDWI